MDNENKNQISKTEDLEAEKSVISSILQDSTKIADVNFYLNGDEFTSNNYKKIFLACVELISRNEEVNLITVRDKLISRGEKGDIIEMNYLKDLAVYESNPMNVKTYVKIVKDKDILRSIINECANINTECISNKDISVTDILRHAQDRFFDLSKKKEDRDYEGLAHIMPRVMQKIQNAAKCKDGMTGVKTGIGELDMLLSGLQKGNLIIIGARPGVGKTAFALNLAYGAVKNGYKAAFFSLEMTREEIASRVLSMESKVSSERLRAGNPLNNNDWSNIINSTTSMSNDLLIDDTSSITIAELRSKCMKMKREYEAMGKTLDVVFIDYLQLMGESQNDANKPRHIQIGAITAGLKGLAKDLDIPIVALAQTRRPGESEDKNKMPRLEDLRESGSIEQDADVVIFLHKNEKEGENVPDNEKMYIIVAKHRNGGLKTFNIPFDKKILLFRKYEKDAE